MAQEEGTTNDPWDPDPSNKDRLRFAETSLWKTLSLPPEVPYKGHLKLSADVSQRHVAGTGALVPTRENWPEFNVEGSASPHGGAVKMGVGLPSDLLRAERHWTFGDTPTITSTVGSNLGPASLYYKTQEQPGSEADMRSQEFGGRLDVGPFSVGGSRMETSQEIMPEKFRRHYEDPRHRFWQDMGWLRGEADILGGAWILNLQRTWSGERQPGYEGKHPPVTEAELSYERALGPGTVRGTARGQMVRDRGKQYGADLLYRFPWLGGKASLSGEFTGRQLPTAQYPMGQPSGWKVGAEWKKRF